MGKLIVKVYMEGLHEIIQEQFTSVPALSGITEYFLLWELNLFRHHSQPPAILYFICGSCFQRFHVTHSSRHEKLRLVMLAIIELKRALLLYILRTYTGCWIRLATHVSREGKVNFSQHSWSFSMMLSQITRSLRLCSCVAVRKIQEPKILRRVSTK